MKKVIFLAQVTLVVLIVLIALPSASFAQTTYMVDSKASSLIWHGEKVLGKHWGYVTIDNGWIKKDGDTYTGEFYIDMTSITDEDIEDPESRGKLVGHLKSDDFFSVNNYKMSKFKLTKVEAKDYGEYNHVVVGDLTIKGITKQISFPAKIEISDKVMTAKAEFEINRTWWNIKYGSGNFFDDLGDKMIYDDIKFELDLVGKAK